MTITWINCAERMPTDDYTRVILRKPGNNSYMHSFGNVVVMGKNSILDMGIEWVTYTEEAWSELNKAQ